MSDTPKPDPRASKVVQEQYGKLCAVAGDKQYRVQALRAELDDINQQLYALNSEFNAAMAKEKENEKVATSEAITSHLQVVNSGAPHGESKEEAQLVTPSDEAQIQPGNVGADE